MAELNSKSIVVFSPGDKNQLLHTNTHTHISCCPSIQVVSIRTTFFNIKRIEFFYEEWVCGFSCDS